MPKLMPGAAGWVADLFLECIAWLRTKMSLPPSSQGTEQLRPPQWDLVQLAPFERTLVLHFLGPEMGNRVL